MKDKALEVKLLNIHSTAKELNKWEHIWATACTDVELENSKQECKFLRRRLEVLLSELGRA